MYLCLYVCFNAKCLALALALALECLDLCLALNVKYLALGLNLRCLLTRLLTDGRKPETHQHRYFKKEAAIQLNKFPEIPKC